MNHHNSWAISSVYGKIEHVLLSYPEIVCTQQFHDSYFGLFNTLRKDTRFFVLAQFNEKHKAGTTYSYFARKVLDLIQNLMENARVSNGYLVDEIIKPLVEYRTHDKRYNNGRKLELKEYLPTEWVQDHFVVLQNSPDSYALLEPVQFRRSNVTRLGDQLIADYVAAQLDYYVKPFAFRLEGGNILVGDNYVLIGSHILFKNWLLFNRKLNFDQIIQYVQWSSGVENIIWTGAQGGFGTEVQVLEGDKTPMHLMPHIDMFITLGGKTERDAELIFVAEITDDSCISVRDNFKNQYNNYLDLVARVLEAYDDDGRFEVERLPNILYRLGDSVLIPFNNCLNEMVEGDEYLFLPEYLLSHSNWAQQTQKIPFDINDRRQYIKLNAPFDCISFHSFTGTNNSLNYLIKVMYRNITSFPLYASTYILILLRVFLLSVRNKKFRGNTLSNWNLKDNVFASFGEAANYCRHPLVKKQISSYILILSIAPKFLLAKVLEEMVLSSFRLWWHFSIISIFSLRVSYMNLIIRNKKIGFRYA